MISEQFEIFVPCANRVKLVIRDLLKKTEYVYNMRQNNKGWYTKIEKPIHDDCLYYYLVNDNFVLTDLVGRINDKNSVPKYSEVRKKMKSFNHDLAIKHINISKYLSDDNRPVGLSDRFNNLDNFVYVIYYYD